MIIQSYRQDIIFLRALSILLVIFFHFDLLFFTSGYVGVDVFFVVSGYVITNKIFKECVTETFSFTGFYTSRIRRLFPALLTVLLITTLLAIVFLSSSSLKSYGLSLFFSSLSLGNIYFWSESGYFEISALYKPLLHTWSLAVEEQFYLIWPVLFYLIFKYCRNWIVVLLVVMTTLSIILVVVSFFEVLIVDRLSQFYLLPFRIYEFLFGAVIVFFTRKRKSNFLFIFGVSLIVFCSVGLFSISDEYLRLLSALGASICIYSRSGLGNRLGTMNSVSWLGSRSYSLYLIHWPLWFFFFYYFQSALSLDIKLFLFVFLALLSELLYRFVETKFRYSKGISVERLLTLTVAISILGLLLYFFNGFPERVEDKKNRIVDYATKYKDAINPNLNDANIGKLLLVGESHSTHFVNLLRGYYNKKGYLVDNVAVSGCVPVVDTFVVNSVNDYEVDKRQDNCKRFNRFKLRSLLKEYDGVILSARWSLYTEDSISSFESLEERTFRLVDLSFNGKEGLSSEKSQSVFELAMRNWVEELSSIKKPVLLMGQVPPLGIDLRDCIGAPWKSITDCEPMLKRTVIKDRFRTHMELFYRLDLLYPSVVFADSFSLLCGSNSILKCPLFIEDVFLYRDDDHINMRASEHLVNLYRPPLDRFFNVLKEHEHSITRNK